MEVVLANGIALLHGMLSLYGNDEMMGGRRHANGVNLVYNQCENMSSAKKTLVRFFIPTLASTPFNSSSGSVQKVRAEWVCRNCILKFVVRMRLSSRGSASSTKIAVKFIGKQYSWKRKNVTNYFFFCK